MSWFSVPKGRTQGLPLRSGGAVRPVTERIAVAHAVLGACCVVLGGAVAAATGPLVLHKGSWLAAYLVLVCGVTGCAIGAMQTRVGRPVSAVVARTQLACWVLGNAAVIAGSLAAIPGIVDGGGVLLVIALGIALHAVRPKARPSVGDVVSRSAGWAYRLLLVVVLLSVPVGLVLAHLSGGP
ncbi:hypothetical protein GCM10009841_34540 [Microlunatus panaciterrae]|uniref:Uncharacterized protein n=1 Tax=Microlunatus panaciterrae TaxID=400768 RepID=A0ABS2RHU9_9ACTN|nr:hypothetical protein [Microlunatus panaciterrae]MBM7798112.1 hypothetical protein [Microlunatus panaciterrae]